jgi:hypothetical protein
VTGDGRFRNPAVTECCTLLKRVKTIAVVGLSPDPMRPSHGVARAMQGFGYTIIPVHPAAREILGVRAYPSLADIPVTVDLVDVFRRAEHIDDIVNDCLRLKLKSLWIQEGIINEPAALRAQAGGMWVVMDRCIYRDYVGYCR